MAPPGLSIDIVDKRFPGAGDALFSGLALDIAPGSVVALLGPSGVGKSSLLRMVAGVDTDFSGTITIGALRADRAPAPGVVFQDPRLLPWLWIGDNIGLAAPGLEKPAIEALLAQVGLPGVSRAFPHQLSGGMQRRAALARALASESDLLLLDEPFVSLDAALAGEMRRVVRNAIVARGSTTLLVSHDPEDAVLLADRVILLSGRPASVAGDVLFEVPQERRDADILAQYQARLAAD